MKCFERMVSDGIKSCLSTTFDPNEFAYQKNRSTEEAFSMATRALLSHLEQWDKYMKMLIIDDRVAFKTILQTF